MALTAAERRARIRARLSEANEPPGVVEETTNTMTEPIQEEESETASALPPRQVGPRRSRPRRAVDKTVNTGKSLATSQRSKKSPNYKLHVLTALSLAVAIRFARYGTQAITG